MIRVQDFFERHGWFLFSIGMLLLLSPILLKITGVPFYLNAQYSDLLISHLPNARFIQTSLAEWGQIPLWNPTLYAGAPFAADPLSGLAYLPNWVAVAFPRPVTFNLLLLIHLFWSAAGCYILARRLNLSRFAGIIFGLAFAGTPKVFAHIGLGHISLVFAVSWTPWLLISVERMVQAFRDGGIRYAAWAGGMLGLIFLVDPRWFFPGLFIASAYAIHRLFLLPKEHRSNTPLLIKAGFIFIGFTIGIAALQAIPLIEFLQHSTRADLSREASNVLALEWSHFLGYFTPILAQAEQVTYLGICVFLLAFIGLLSRREGTAFWGLIFIASMMFSLGNATPLFPLITRLVPGAGFLRVPPRALFLVGFAGAALAANGVEHLLKGNGTSLTIKRLRGGTLGLLLLALLLNLILAASGVGSWNHHLVVCGLAIVGIILVELSLRSSMSAGLLGRLWMIAIILDLAWVQWIMIRVEPYRSIMEEQKALTTQLPKSYGSARIFSPSYAISQLTAASRKLELADGVNPLQVAEYANYLQRAVGFEAAGYGVTLPPYPSGNPKQPWDIKLDVERLGRLNVKYIASDYALDEGGLTYLETADGVYLYAVEGAKSRAWVLPDDQDEWIQAEVYRWTPNWIEVRAEGPGMLILSEVSYPGWGGTLDGQKSQLQVYDGLFRTVMLPEGQHIITFSFHPWSVYLGLAIFSLTLLFGILLTWKR
jgi:hypothetical protein